MLRPPLDATLFKPKDYNKRLLKIIKSPEETSHIFFLEEVEELLRLRSANPNYLNSDGDTLLHVIIKNAPEHAYSNEYSNDLRAAIDLLEKYGADLLAFDRCNKSPWFYAVRQPRDWLSMCFVTTILSALEFSPDKLKGKESILREEVLAVMRETGNHYLVVNVRDRLDNAFARLQAREQGRQIQGCR